MRHTKLLIIIALFSVKFCFAQKNQKLDSILNHHAQKTQKIDSLLKVSQKQINDTLKVDALARLYNTFLYNAPDLAKRFAKKELEVSKKINYRRGVGWATYHLGAYFQNAGNIDSSKYYLRQALSVHKNLGQLVEYASTLNSLAFFDYTVGDYDKAITKYDEILAIYKDSSLYQYAISLSNRANIYINKGYYKIALEETLDALRILDTIHSKPLRKADAQRQVGYIEFLRENFKNAKKYFESASKIYSEQNDHVYASSINNDIGNVYYHLKKYDSAIHHLNQGLHLAQEFGITENEGNALSNLGKAYTQKKEYQRALEYLNAALEIHTTNNYKANILWTQNDIGNTYLAMGQPKKGIPFLTKTIESATGEGPINELKNAYDLRFQALRKIGDLENAIAAQLMFQKLKDSIFNSKKSQQIEELRTIYETEKKEQQIAIQKNEISLLEQEAKINNLQQLLLGGGLGLSLLLLGFGYYGIRQKLKRNQLEKEKVDAELAYKKKELTTHALHLAKKNEVLESLKQKAKELKLSENGRGYQQLIQTINFDQQDDKNWENFTQYFEQVHKNFASDVKTRYPEVTKNELRFMALLKMNMSSKEIATILNISDNGIKKARQRLRKKMGLTPMDSLEAKVLSI